MTTKLTDRQYEIYHTTYATVLNTVAPRVATFGEAVQQATDAAKAAVDQHPDSDTGKPTTTKKA